MCMQFLMDIIVFTNFQVPNNRDKQENGMSGLIKMKSSRKLSAKCFITFVWLYIYLFSERVSWGSLFQFLI